MSIAKVTEILARSPKSFDNAIEEGVERAAKTLKNVKSARVTDQSVDVDNGKITSYNVRMKVTFILE